MSRSEPRLPLSLKPLSVVRKIVLLPQAAEDLDAIQEPLYSEILRKIRLLQDFPQLGAVMQEAFQGYRSLVAAPFRVIYRIASEDRIEVAYIFSL